MWRRFFWPSSRHDKSSRFISHHFLTELRLLCSQRTPLFIPFRSVATSVNNILAVRTFFIFQTFAIFILFYWKYVSVFRTIVTVAKFKLFVLHVLHVSELNLWVHLTLLPCTTALLHHSYGTTYHHAHIRFLINLSLCHLCATWGLINMAVALHNCLLWAYLRLTINLQY